jgi:hypothetical protein
MARTSLANVSSIADPATSWEYDLFLPTIPGSTNTSQVTFRCQSSALPGAALDPVEVALHGVVLKYAGRAIYTHTFESVFMEGSDYLMRTTFINWRESARSWLNNTGTLASAYKVNGQIQVYNSIPNVVKTVNIYGMWPETVGDYPLDGTASNLLTLTVTWQFDYTEDA